MFSKKPTVIHTTLDAAPMWQQLNFQHQAEMAKAEAENRALQAKIGASDLKKWAVEQAIKAGSGYGAVELATEIERYVTGQTHDDMLADLVKGFDFPTADEIIQRLRASK